MSEHRRAIVTGGSSGIGRATAVALARDGFDVGVTFATDQAGAEETGRLVKAMGRRFAHARADFAELGVVPVAIRTLTAELGGVDALINNAGVNRRASALDESLASWDEVIAVNLTAPWLAAKAVAPTMTAQGGGRIINVTSILASDPLSGGAAYCASKAGLDALTRVLAIELAPLGILVNSVAPGHTLTPMNYAFETPSAQEFPRPVIPMKRPADPSEIAAAIAFLASPAASYITGTSLLVDGGLRLVSGPETFQDATGMPPGAKT